MSYVVEQGIPPPPAFWNQQRTRKGRYVTELSRVMGDLQPGESFLLPTKEEETAARGRVWIFAPKKFAIRKIPGKGWRVWRLS